MALKYVHLSPSETPPQLTCEPFRALIVSEVEVTQEWRDRIAKWLLESGCLYVIAWGVECENWHDTVDWTNLEEFDFGDIPDSKFVMTTWHTNDPLFEAMWFAGQCAFHADVELTETVIVHVAAEPRQAELLENYTTSQELPSDE